MEMKLYVADLCNLFFVGRKMLGSIRMPREGGYFKLEFPQGI